ncbi:hypothetical protein [Bradyrhizobium sp. JYMT SZCCT0428]|uniref:hypothetical protein n=1 Tax=Bradyrhizobium sp. JYMT SZCCT0428 TaxID=2807673 RepID=UPI001BA4AB96|nr:hypothetical protein [Bradyrhizobium sp. JYMT SZCCT0428]MBR1152969.1 hypothetical protein [Bradyrhizobium sp. JYMT SZCCT0428]
MSIAYQLKLPPFAPAVILLSSLLLGGCASSAGSSLMDARAEVPTSQKTSSYPAVFDPSPKRKIPAMTPDERSKLSQELNAALDRAAAAKAQGGPLKPINR